MLQHSTLLLKHKSDLGQDVNKWAGLHSNKTGAGPDRTDVDWPALGGAAGGLPKDQAFMAPSLVRLGSSSACQVSSHLRVFAPVASSTWRAPSSDTSHLILSTNGTTERPPWPCHPEAHRAIVHSLNSLCFPHGLHTTCHDTMSLCVWLLSVSPTRFCFITAIFPAPRTVFGTWLANMGDLDTSLDLHVNPLPVKWWHQIDSCFLTWNLGWHPDGHFSFNDWVYINAYDISNGYICNFTNTTAQGHAFSFFGVMSPSKIFNKLD